MHTYSRKMNVAGGCLSVGSRKREESRYRLARSRASYKGMRESGDYVQAEGLAADRVEEG